VRIRNLFESFVQLLRDEGRELGEYRPRCIIQHDEGVVIPETGAGNKAHVIPKGTECGNQTHFLSDAQLGVRILSRAGQFLLRQRQMELNREAVETVHA
jgi:hypothetical protein